MVNSKGIESSRLETLFIFTKFGTITSIMQESRFVKFICQLISSVKNGELSLAVCLYGVINLPQPLVLILIFCLPSAIVSQNLIEEVRDQRLTVK